MGDRIPRARALRIAEALVETLRPACERIEIAGSIRRGKPDVKDIEIVCAPRLRRDLLGEWLGEADGDELRPVVQGLVAAGRLLYRRRADAARARHEGAAHERVAKAEQLGLAGVA